MWDDVRTGVNCMRWYVPTGNVGIGFTGDAKKETKYILYLRCSAWVLFFCENVAIFVVACRLRSAAYI